MFTQFRHIIILVILFFIALRIAAQHPMPDHVCTGTTKHYHVDPNPVPGSTYSWRIEGVALPGSTTHEIDITWEFAGTYLLEVQELSANGCPGPVRSGEVFVLTLGLAATGISASTCDGYGSIEFSFSNVPNGIYAINYDGGSFSNVAVRDDKANVSVPAGDYQNLSITIAGITSSPGVNITLTDPEPLARPLISTNKNVSCQGLSNGEITVTLSGGRPDYYYSFDGGITWSATALPSPIVITGLSAGLYSVTVKDANHCISSQSATTLVREPEILNAIVTGINSDCVGGTNGSATVTVDGGTTPYSYLWSNGQTTAGIANLTEGLYSVTITDSKNCTTSISRTVSLSPDVTKPAFIPPDPFIGCVEDLRSVRYNPLIQMINYDQPDFYTFQPGNSLLDLNTALFSDNCNLAFPVQIRWRIDFSPAPDPTPPHNLVTKEPITGTGQPSATAGSIQFPGDGVNYNVVIHRITYWIVDCSGNISDPKTQTITIRPRPKIINGM